MCAIPREGKCRVGHPFASRCLGGDYTVIGECSGIPATNRIGNIVPRIFKPSRLPPQIRAGITRGNKRGGGNRKIRIKEISHNISFIRLYA